MFLPFEESLLNYALSSAVLQILSKLSVTIYVLLALYVYVIWKRSRIPTLCYYILALALTTAFVFLIKQHVGILRPFQVMNIAMNIPEYIGSSFPSAHATLSFFCAAVLVSKLRKKSMVTHLIYLWALTISLARFLAGLHYIVDLIGGGFIGYAAGKLSMRYEGSVTEFGRYLIRDLEGRRKSIHILAGFLLSLMVYFWPRELASLILFSSSVIAFVVSFLFISGKLPSFLSELIHRLERDEEKEVFPAQGAFFFFLSSTFVTSLFPKHIAAAAIVALALGDGFATLFGRRYGKRRLSHNLNKSLEGSLAGFFGCFAGSLLFLDFWSSVINSVVFTIAESMHLEFKGKRINDNIYIPLVCALSLYIAQSL